MTTSIPPQARGEEEGSAHKPPGSPFPVTEGMHYDVCIIGAGFAGLYTLKHCLEAGLRAVVLEKTGNLGGVWNVANAPDAVQPFTYSVTSKLYLSPSNQCGPHIRTEEDFPPPESWAEFPHASLVYQHLLNYAAHFQLLTQTGHRPPSVVVS